MAVRYLHALPAGAWLARGCSTRAGFQHKGGMVLLSSWWHCALTCETPGLLSSCILPLFGLGSLWVSRPPADWSGTCCCCLPPVLLT